MLERPNLCLTLSQLVCISLVALVGPLLMWLIHLLHQRVILMCLWPAVPTISVMAQNNQVATHGMVLVLVQWETPGLFLGRLLLCQLQHLLQFPRYPPAQNASVEHLEYSFIWLLFVDPVCGLWVLSLHSLQPCTPDKMFVLHTLFPAKFVCYFISTTTIHTECATNAFKLDRNIQLSFLWFSQSSTRDTPGTQFHSCLWLLPSIFVVMQWCLMWYGI
jgi:hypothetical protein